MNFGCCLMGSVPGAYEVVNFCLIGDESAAREMARNFEAISGLDLVAFEPISDEERDRIIAKGLYTPENTIVLN